MSRLTVAETAQRVAPELAETADEADRLRRLPDATWKLLVDSGLTRALQPARWGGAETTLTDFLDAVMEVSRAAPSAGWVLGVMGVHPWQLALFPEEAQREMWAEDPARDHSSSYSPTGTAERVDGGYRISGRWSFSTGCDHGYGVNLGVIAGPRIIEGMELPDFRSVLLLPGQYHIEDTWHTAGMRGTGSKDIVVDEAFVPDHRSQSHLDYMFWRPLPGQEVNAGPLYRLPWSVVFNFALAASVFGAARGFCDLWAHVTANRVAAGGAPVAQDPLTQVRLAEAEWTLDAAVTGFRRDSDALYALAEAGERPDERTVARMRWHANHGAELVGRDVTMLYHATTGRTAFVDHPLHRPFQDIQTMLGHQYLSADGHARNYAGHLLGVGAQVVTP